jgi:carboxylate-amine ligase
MKDFYWDIRPKPEYGTIELRVCDTPLTVERAAALACYLQAICRMLLARREPQPIEDDYLVYNYNRFQACRFGLDGMIVHPRTAETMSLREDILATLRRVELDAEVLRSRAALDEVRAIVGQGNDAAFLRRECEAEGGVQGMVESAVRRFRTGDSE